MVEKSPAPSDGEHQILSFRRRPGGVRRPLPTPPPVDDLAKFSRGDDKDDYRHRMMVNAAAFLFVALLIAAGLWLADTMAALRRGQDCVMSGRRNCAPIEVNKDRF